VTDGAAAVVLMRRSKAKELGVEILAKYVTTAVAGKFSSYHLTK
jgi:acetyl-CoA acetyltransferase